MEAEKAEMSIYDPKNPHGKLPPVLRCMSCSKIVLKTTLNKIGSCSHCGNRRVTTLRIFNDEEKAQMEAWGVDPVFLDEFKGVELDEGGGAS